MTERQPEREQGDTVRVSTGVVFRLKQPSAWAVTARQKRHDDAAPKPPVWRNPDKERDEPNEADPDYRRALERHEAARTEMLFETLVLTGTEVAELPDGLPSHDTPGWETALTFMGIEVPADGAGRYVAWVKYLAAPGNVDWTALHTPLLIAMGTTEEDVASAIATFRSLQEQRAHNRASTERDRDDGDRV